MKINTSSIFYFAPDTLEWEDMGLTFPQLVRWLVEGNVDLFYMDFRWDNWESEVNELNFSEGISFYPFLWAKSEQERHRRIIQVEEIVLFSFDTKKQLGF